MIKHQRTNIKILALSFLIEIISFIGIYFLRYYTRTRMGMVRHVVYLNGKWERGYNINFFKYIIIGLIVLLIMILLRNLIVNKDGNNILTSLSLLAVTIVPAYYISYIITNNKTIDKAYYLIVLVMALATFIITVFQLIEIYISFLKKRKRERRL